MKTRMFRQAASLFALFDAANRAAGAAEAGRMPSREALRVLAIDPAQYGRIGR